MIIYPCLEVMGGKVVTLTRGRLNEPVLWHVDPIETARRFAAAGASWMHLTDFDALSGGETDEDLLHAIILAAGIPVQMGGGFRSRERVLHWLDKGAGRIVLGTVAVHDPGFVRDLAKFHPDQIVLAVDIFQGQLMTHGWQTPSPIDPEAFLAAFHDTPLAGVIITDIDADIEDSDGSLGVITGLAEQTRHEVIVRGVVRTVDDIARLKYVPNIAGALVARALLAHDIDLEEAILTATPSPETHADFL